MLYSPISFKQTELFKNDVVAGLQPTWAADPDIRFYETG